MEGIWIEIGDWGLEMGGGLGRERRGNGQRMVTDKRMKKGEMRTKGRMVAGMGI